MNLINQNLSIFLFQNSKNLKPLEGDGIKLIHYDDEEIKRNAIQINQSNNNNSYSEVEKNKNLKKIESKINKNENKKYNLISNDTSIIKFPNKAHITEDEDEYNLVNLINEPLNSSWKIQIDDEKYGVKIYKKDLSYIKSPLLKCFCSIPFNLKIIISLIKDLNFRKEWDKKYSKIDLIEKLENENLSECYILYCLLNVPYEREIISKYKFWNNYLNNSKKYLIHYKSVNHINFPEKIKPLRTKIIIGGFYFEEINPTLTKCIIISHFDDINKIDIHSSDEKVYEYIHDYIKCLIKGCNLYIKSNKI